MKEFVEKLIGRLEEQKSDWNYDYNVPINDAIKIVNELAEEYKNTNIITDFLQYTRDNADNYDTNEGWSLADLTDLSIKYSDEYINTSTDTSSGWIPCSERLPKKSGKYIVTQERYAIDDRFHTGRKRTEVDYVGFNASDNMWLRANFFNVIAWQPLPAPYKEGATENE